MGYLPCFSKHSDRHYSVDTFFSNKAFVNKLEAFLKAIIRAGGTYDLKKQNVGKKIEMIDPLGSTQDKKLCQKLGWYSSKVYYVSYGNTPYRLLFGLDGPNKRCYILGLDNDHQSRPYRKQRR